MTKRFALLISLIFLTLVGAGAVLMPIAYAQNAEKSQYVIASSLNVRLCSASKCPVTNRIYKGQKVTVYEISGNWARTSKYYDSAAERMEFPSIKQKNVARWVWAKFLSDTKPAEAKELRASTKYFDPRIKGIPKPGEYGLTSDEVLLMRRYAYGMLKTKRCNGKEYADKSTKRTNTYYVNCSGEMKNRFFVASDVKAGW